MDIDKREVVEFDDVEVIGASVLAILCNINGKRVWIPQSQIHDDSEVWKQGDRGKLMITRWIAELKQLI